MQQADELTATTRQLITAVQAYVDGVETLEGPLDVDIHEASEACWSIEQRTVQVKSKLLVSFRSRQVQVYIPEFVPEAEQQLLGAALKQWQNSAEGAVASSILDVKVAEQRLCHATYSLVESLSADANTLQHLTRHFLTAVAELQRFTDKASSSAHTMLKGLVTFVSSEYLKASKSSSSDGLLEAQRQLIAILLEHPHEVSWACSLLQVSAENVAALLPALLSDTTDEQQQHGTAAEQLSAKQAILMQLPWGQISELEHGKITADICSPLLHYLGQLAQQHATDASYAAHMAQSVMQVLLSVAKRASEVATWIHSAMQVALLSMANGLSVQAGLDALGGSFEAAAGASLMAWAEAAGRAEQGCQNPAVPLTVVQCIDWQGLAVQLPGRQKTTALLALASVAGLARPDGSNRQQQQYVSWLWSLLLSQAGKALVQLDAADLQEYVQLCQTEAPSGSKDVEAVWRWTQAQLAVSLLEHWSTAESYHAEQAASFLQSSNFFSSVQLVQELGQAEAVVYLMMRFVDAAGALGDDFFRQHVGMAATALASSLRPATAGASPSSAGPIRATLQRLIKRGIAVNEATQTPPDEESPDGSPHSQSRTPRPPKRGSTTSPGQEALSKAAHWLALLVCCHYKAGLASDALILINDLVQLLYYHGSNVAHGLEPQEQDGDIHLLSPLVQECMGVVVEAIGAAGARELWGPLMQLEATNARNLQWLAVLACWLSNTASRASVSAPSAQGTPLQNHAASAQVRDNELYEASPQSSPSKPPPTPPPHTVTDTPHTDSAYPSPPGAPAPEATPSEATARATAMAATPPPPSYEEAMKKSGTHKQAGPTGSSMRTAMHAAGTEPQSDPDAGAAPSSPGAGPKLEAIDRNAEEALQIQEAATGIGYGAAALSLWEEFVIRFFQYETQLGSVLPKQDISNHLQQLAHLYQSSSPVLSNIYTLLSCLSPEQLPGGTPRVVAENKEALRSLMQLHPLNLTKPGSSSAAPDPPSPNPLLETNPFGAVPLSALRESPRSAPAKRQGNSRDDAGHFGTALAAESAAGHQKAEEGWSESAGPHQQAGLFSQADSGVAASCEAIVKDQQALAEEISMARAALRPWARRAEKQAARAPQEPPAQLGGTGSGRQGLGRQVSRTSSSLGSPLSSTGSARGIDAYLARSTRDGDNPEAISQAQGKLWEVTAASSEELERLHAAMRELVCRRYKHPDLEKIANGELGDVEEVLPLEDPTYQAHMQSLREAAFKVVQDLGAQPGLAHAARLLYQLEVLLLQPDSKKMDADEREAEADSRCQLLLVLAEVTLDGSTPLICTPAFTALFCQAAAGALPIGPTTKVKLCRRILHALSSNIQPQQQEREAVTLLKASLDPNALLSGGSLQDFEACLDTILFHSHHLLPATVETLLGCFDLTQYASRLLEGGSPRKAEQEEPSATSMREDDVKPPRGVSRVMTLTLATLSLKGGAATGAALLQGLLVTSPASYYAAALQLAITGEEEAGRQAAIKTLLQIPVSSLPLPVLLDSLLQIAEAMQSHQLAPPDLPQRLLHALLQAPPILAALRSIIAGGPPVSTGTQNQEGRSGVFWSAKVGNTQVQDEGQAGASNRATAPSLGQLKQAVLLLPVNVALPADQCLLQLIGAWLQSILRKFGSGVDPVPLTEEFTSLLGSLFEPAGSHPWLVDWLWTLYEAALQPFLCLAGPASDGTAVNSFREYWQSLPWQRATFHCISPDALQALSSLLYSSDRAVLQLLHVLDWQPVLQQIAPVIQQLQASDAPTSTSSLLDADLSTDAQSASPRLAQDQGRNNKLQSMRSLDATAKAWAAHLMMLLLPAFVIMAETDLPAWLQRLISQEPGSPDSEHAETSSLRLDHILAAADLETMQQQMSQKGADGAPFLLQPLVAAPHLIDGEPNLRLLLLAKLLTKGALLNGSAKAASVAACTIQQIMLVSVCRGFTSQEGAGSGAGGEQLDILECWHLGSQDMQTLLQDCLLPLAAAQASSELARSLQQATDPSSHPAKQQPLLVPERRWRAPALSSLVNRLSHPASNFPELQAGGKGTAATASREAQPARHQKQFYLDGSSDEEEAAVAEVLPAAADSQQGGLSIYTMAAEPFRALLACVAKPPEMLVTLEPLPFANAEGPLKLWPPQQLATPARTVSQQVSEQHALHGQSPHPAAPGKESSVSNLKARMAALKKGMGMGSSDVKGTKLAAAAAATDAAAIQHGLAVIIQEALQQQKPEVSMCLLRVIFTTSLSSPTQIASALTEDIILSLLLRQQHFRTEAARGGLTRQGSYTEAQLGAPVPHEEVVLVEEVSQPDSAPSGQLDAPIDSCLEGLPQEALLSICQTAAGLRMPLTVWLTTERLRHNTLAMESVAWRDLVADVLGTAAKVQAHPVAPLHVVYPWLQLLLWLADGRWRKLGGAAPFEQLQHLLDCMQGHVALLWTAHSSTSTHDESGLFAGAAERLRQARSEVKARLNRESGSTAAPGTPSSPGMTSQGSGSLWGSAATQEEGPASRLGAGFKNLLSSNKDSARSGAEEGQPKAGRFAALRAKMSKSSEPVKADRQASAEQPLAGKLTGLKNRLMKPSFSSASPASSSTVLPPQQPVDSAYDFGALADDSQAQDQQPAMTQHPAGSARPLNFGPRAPSQGQAAQNTAPGAKSNLTGRFGNLRKAIGISQKDADAKSEADTEAAQAAAQAAESLVQVGLAAFAISAYIRSTLCPDLQSYEPRPRIPSALVNRQATSSHAQHKGAFMLQRTRNGYHDLMNVATSGHEDLQQEAGLGLEQHLLALDDVCAQASEVAPASKFVSQLHGQWQGLVSSPSVGQFQQSLQALLLPLDMHVQ